MIATHVCLVLLAVAAAASPARKADYCYADITHPYLQLGSKTAYEFIHPKDTTVENIPNCKPVQIWMLSRHGTRFPGKSTIKKLKKLPSFRDKILANHGSSRPGGMLCQKDLDNLRTWSFNISESQRKLLAPQGEVDMKQMALRLKQKFPTLLQSPYKQDLYQFRYTDTQRTQVSAEKFAEGLFGSIDNVYFPPTVENDPIIKVYNNCTRWINEVDDNDEAIQEATEFKNGHIVDEVKKAVSKRLGFKDTLKYKQLDSMYDMCRFDKAWNTKQLSPWCAVFTEDELKVLEYYEDMLFYYENGYGNEININLGCPSVKDFIDRFRQQAEGNDSMSQQPAGVFYFTHDTMMHMVQARLGLNKDPEPLLASNYDRMHNRQWKISRIGSFAANIEAVLYRCTEGETNRVRFYQSEKPIEMPGCDGSLCSWKVVMEKFSTVAEQCNLDFCKDNEES